MNVLVRSHTDTSGSGGLTIGLHTVLRSDLIDYVAFFLTGEMSFPLPINQWEALNQQFNEQVYNLYQSDEDNATAIATLNAVSAESVGEFIDTIVADGSAGESVALADIPPTVLPITRDRIKVEYSGRAEKTSATETISLYFSGNVIANFAFVPVLTDGAWRIQVTIIRTASDSIKCTTAFGFADEFSFIEYAELGGIDFSAPNTLDLQWTPSGSGTLTFYQGDIWKMPTRYSSVEEHPYLLSESGDSLTSESGDYLRG